MDNPVNNDSKLRIAVRYRLLGAANANNEFKVALAAFEFAEQRTTGFRKNGTTPNFMHPVEVGAYLMTLQSSLRHPGEALAASFLHDVMEDYGVTFDELRERFGHMVAHATMRLSKVVGGVKLSSMDEYFENMLDCPIAPCVKGSDRINNQGTMVGAFSPLKQMEYVEESEKYILPMLKKARRLYSDQEAVFENIKLMLKNQVLLVRAIHQTI